MVSPRVKYERYNSDNLLEGLAKERICLAIIFVL